MSNDEESGRDYSSLSELEKFKIVTEEEWLTTAEAAEETGLTVDTVGKYCNSGKLIGLQVAGRWFIEPTSAKEFDRKNTGRPRAEDKD